MRRGRNSIASPRAERAPSAARTVRGTAPTRNSWSDATWRDPRNPGGEQRVRGTRYHPGTRDDTLRPRPRRRAATAIPRFTLRGCAGAGTQCHAAEGRSLGHEGVRIGDQIRGEPRGRPSGGHPASSASVRRRGATRSGRRRRARGDGPPSPRRSRRAGWPCGSAAAPQPGPASAARAARTPRATRGSPPVPSQCRNARRPPSRAARRAPRRRGPRPGWERRRGLGSPRARTGSRERVSSSSSR